jgi:hypothetical protein
MITPETPPIAQLVSSSTLRTLEFISSKGALGGFGRAPESFHEVGAKLIED